MSCGHDATVDNTNVLQACRSHLITMMVRIGHMQRPEVQTRREPDTRARRATEVSACVHVPYARVQTREHMCGRLSRPMRPLPSSPAWPDCSHSSRGRPPARLSPTPASTLTRSPLAFTSHVNGAGGVGGGVGEGCKHSPVGRADDFSMLVPVVARNRRAARAARRPAKHNTWSGQWMGGRHQRGGATGSAEHLKPRSMRSSGRR
jgi:hypothetical protein